MVTVYTALEEGTFGLIALYAKTLSQELIIQWKISTVSTNRLS